MDKQLKNNGRFWFFKNSKKKFKDKTKILITIRKNNSFIKTWPHTKCEVIIAEICDLPWPSENYCALLEKLSKNMGGHCVISEQYSPNDPVS